MTTGENRNLLHIAADYVRAGQDLDGAIVLGAEVEDRRPAIEAEWTAALSDFIDSRVRVSAE